MQNIDKYIYITPLAILAFGGSFVLVSLTNEAIFIKEALLVFLWGICSCFARQIFKDKLFFLINNGCSKYGSKHRNYWLIYYSIQALFFIVFTYLIYEPVFSSGIVSTKMMDSSFLNWNVWRSASFWQTMVLATTACFICWQAWESRKSGKYLEHSIKPIAWFIIRSAKTLIEREYIEKDKISKYDSRFIVVNGSNFPILFFFKISWGKDGIKLPVNETYWIDNPLHIYPDRMSYPFALLNLSKVAKDLNVDENSKGEISANIEYHFAARHSPNKKFQGLTETWRFSLSKEVWVGPNGIEDNNIFLPKEGLVQKVSS